MGPAHGYGEGERDADPKRHRAGGRGGERGTASSRRKESLQRGSAEEKKENQLAEQGIKRRVDVGMN